MRAIKLNEALAQSQGISPLSYKLLALALSAFLAGVVGGLFVFYLTIVDPSIFDFYYTETMLIMVIIGGPGSFWGVLGASAVLAALPDLLRFTTDLRMVLYGAVLIAAMLVFPGGVGGWLRRRGLRRWRRPQPGYAHDAAARGDGAHQALPRTDRGGRGGVRGGGGHGGRADRPERLGKEHHRRLPQRLSARRRRTVAPRRARADRPARRIGSPAPASPAPSRPCAPTTS